MILEMYYYKEITKWGHDNWGPTVDLSMYVCEMNVSVNIGNWYTKLLTW